MKARHLYLTQGLALALGMALTSVLGNEWAPLRGAFSPVSPVGGVALAGLVLGGLRMLPWVVVGGAIGRLINPPDWPPSAVVAIFICNILAFVLAAAYLRAGTFHRELSTLADVKRFLVACAILAGASLLVPLILVIPAILTGTLPSGEGSSILVGLFFGKFSGAAIVAAPILTFPSRELSNFFSQTRSSSVSSTISAIVITMAVFGPLDVERPLAWLLFPVLILPSSAGGTRLTSLIILIVGAGAVLGTTCDWGPFAHLPYRFSVLQLFLSTFAATGLVLASTATERRDNNVIAQRAADLKFLSECAVDLLLSSDIPASLQKHMPSLAHQCNMDLILYHSSRPDGSLVMRQEAAHGLERYAEDALLLSHIERQVHETARHARPEAAYSDTVQACAIHGSHFTLQVFACFPIFDGTGIRGVLSVGSCTRSQIDPGESKLLETVASYLRSADRRMHEEAERKALLESERAARTAAERADQVKNEFLAVLSHELRNPLNSIVGWTQLLQRGKVDVSRAAHIIEQSARLQSQLIEDLLDMSRIESGKLTLRRAPVDVSSLIAGACDSMQPLARDRGIQLELHLEPGIQLLWADSVRINQIVTNLLSNALKFTHRDGLVTVSLGRESRDAVLTVTDTGEGIPEDFIPHIFERFRQADPSTTRRHGGLGLGLAIAKRMVELHGGTIVARSPGLGKGATFVVRLPVDARAGGAEAASISSNDLGEPAATLSLAGRTIVVVEDDAAFGELLARTLTDKGASVISCERGAEALKRIGASTPDLIISDIGMPDMDGYELIRRVREAVPDGSRPPAIAVSAFARAEDVAKALKAGFNAHVPKPVDLHQLELMVAKLAGTDTCKTNGAHAGTPEGLNTSSPS